jgi:predicted nucleic acid-binding protein
MSILQPDVVFIDTSVFVAENFFAPDNRIHSLSKLAKDNKIRLVMSEITRQEIYKRIKSTVRQSWKQFDKDCRIFRNNVEIDQWRKSTNEKKEIEKLIVLFDKFLTETHTKILDYSYCSDAGKVFIDYFEKHKPFGDGQKKDEFPDAFVLTSLEKYASEIHQKVIVLSKDGDMLGYESKNLICEDYGQYVSKKMAEGVALVQMVRRLQADAESLKKEITSAAIEYLEDFRLYQTLLNLDEVSYFSVNEVNVELNENDYEVVSVNDTFIEIELQPTIAFKVGVDYVNYAYAIYDSEDGKWYGTENETYEVDSEAIVCVTLRYYYGHRQGVDYLETIDMELSSLSDAIR